MATEIYNLTTLQGNNLLNFVTASNDLVGGLVGIAVLIVLFVVVYVSSLKYGSMTALGAAMFFTNIMAILFIVTGFIEQGILIYPVILMSLTGAFLWLKGSNM